MEMLQLALRLLYHQWIASFRSVVRPQNLAGTVILAILVTVLGVNLLSLGLFLDEFLGSLDPGIDPVNVVNGVLLYYFLVDLLLRLWFQRIPGQSVRPYLALPVPRVLLVRVVLAKSLVSLFNALPLLLFVPIALRVVFPLRGAVAAAAWIAVVLGLMLCSGMAILYVKKQELVHPWWGAGVLAALALVAGLEYAGVFSLRTYSAMLFGFVIEHPWVCALPGVLFLGLWRATHRLLRGRLTLEDLPDTGAIRSGRFAFRAVERLGPTGRLAALELKMLIRNRRPRAMVVFAGAMIPFLLAFEAYWLEAMPDRSEIYPVPDSAALQRAAAGDVGGPAGEELRRVTFVVHPRSVPEGTWVHLTGNLPALGAWEPGAVPMLPQPDGTWRRTVALPRDTLIEFRFTLGSWDVQRLEADGSRPVRPTLRVAQDTTVTYAAERWRSPAVFVLVAVNMIYIGILLSGMFLLSYGQLLLGWEGSYFEGLLARAVSLPHYIRAKYMILGASVAISFLLTLPLGIVKPWFVPANGAVALYNAGVNSFILLMMAQFSRRPVDLNASVFSMQGKGSVQILLLAPVLLIPLLIYAGCALAGVEDWTFWILAGMGLAGLAAHRWLLALVVRRIRRNKHVIVAAYRLA